MLLYCSLFGFPEHYTDVGNLSISSRRSLLGQAWSIPVIKHLLRPLRAHYGHWNISLHCRYYTFMLTARSRQWLRLCVLLLRYICYWGVSGVRPISETMCVFIFHTSCLSARNCSLLLWYIFSYTLYILIRILYIVICFCECVWRVLVKLCADCDSWYAV